VCLFSGSVPASVFAFALLEINCKTRHRRGLVDRSRCVLAPSPAGPQQIPEDRERMMALLSRGNDQLQHGNVAAARLYYQRAADTAALALASTYDPDELVRLSVVGTQPDRELARRWYERARELGAPEAERRLKRLSAKQIDADLSSVT
jgi:hypothetical protein